MYRVLISSIFLFTTSFAGAQPRGFYLGGEVIPGIVNNPGVYFPGVGTGMGIGAYGGYMADRNMGAFTGLYFRAYRFKPDRETGGTQKLSYLDMPVALNINLYRNSRKRFFIHLGAMASFLAQANYSGDVFRRFYMVSAGNNRGDFKTVLIKPFIEYGFNFISRNRATSISFGWHFSVAGENAYRDNSAPPDKEYSNTLLTIGLKLGASYSFPMKYHPTAKKTKPLPVPFTVKKGIPDNYY